MDNSCELDTFRSKWLAELQTDRSSGSSLKKAEQASENSHSKDRQIKHEFRDLLGPPGEAFCEFVEQSDEKPDIRAQSSSGTKRPMRSGTGNKCYKDKKRRQHSNIATSKNYDVKATERYLDMFLADLDEINDIPFFDLDIPREIAIKIFQHLSDVDLCRCSQVSKAWRSMADDELLWSKICHQRGFEKTTLTYEKINWKDIVKYHVMQTKKVQQNWKNRVGRVSSLQYVPGGVLRAVASHKQLVVAGYSSRDVKLWNMQTDESCILRASDVTHQLHLAPGNQGTYGFGLKQVTCNQSYTVGVYRGVLLQDMIDLWSNTNLSSTQAQGNVTSEHHVTNMVLTEHTDILITSTRGSVNIYQISQETENSSNGEKCLITCNKVEKIPFESDQDAITDLAVVPRHSCPRSAADYAIVANSGSKVNVHISGRPVSEMTSLYDVVLQNIPLMTCTDDECVLAVHDLNPGFSNNMYMICVCDIHTGVQTCKFSSGASILSCLYKNAQVPNLIAAGTYTSGIKIFDQRLEGNDVLRLRDVGHSTTVIQMDDWKVVSGAHDGFVTVWDYRIPHKCWDMHNRCPVKYLKFHNNSLVTANIPAESSLGAHLADDTADGMTHQRYRGSMYVYDFNEYQDSKFLPTICHSDYDMPEQYSYNIRLAVPYDRV